jgi:lysophospholipase L1-like esterase
VLVVGESQAGTLATGAPKPASPHGLVARRDLVLWDSTILACSIASFPEFVLPGGEVVPNPCGGAGRWQQQWTTDVQATRPDVVFLMAGGRDLFDVVGPDGTVLHPGDRAWVERYTADVRELFRIARLTGAPVVAVKPTCYGRNNLPDAEVIDGDVRLEPARARAVTAVWQSAAAASGVRLLDLDAVTCPGGVAEPVLRADGVHFTVAGADRLAPTIARALRRAVGEKPSTTESSVRR